MGYCSGGVEGIFTPLRHVHLIGRRLVRAEGHGNFVGTKQHELDAIVKDLIR